MVELRSDDNGKFMLAVGNDGVGFPEALDYENTASLGIKIVNSLTDQIEGD